MPLLKWAIDIRIHVTLCWLYYRLEHIGSTNCLHVVTRNFFWLFQVISVHWIAYMHRESVYNKITTRSQAKHMLNVRAQVCTLNHIVCIILYTITPERHSTLT